MFRQSDFLKISPLLGLISLGISNLFVLVSAQTIGIQEIKGKTSGKVNSGDCGYIASQPNHIINLLEPVYSMKIQVEANQGKPSLLILGPGSNDRFCILGEPSAGKFPEMGGVWEAGKYLIYIGDIQGKQYPFTLKVTTSDN